MFAFTSICRHHHHNWKSAMHQPRGQLQVPAPPTRTCLSTHNQRAWMVGRLRNEPGHLAKEGGKGPGADRPYRWPYRSVWGMGIFHSVGSNLMQWRWPTSFLTGHRSVGMVAE